MKNYLRLQVHFGNKCSNLESYFIQYIHFINMLKEYQD